jgi:hypothetical protein
VSDRRIFKTSPYLVVLNAQGRKNVSLGAA